MHPSTEILVALADGELEGRELAWTARHVDACATCTATLADLRETHALFAEALHRFDATEPPEWAAAIAALETMPELEPRALDGDRAYPSRATAERSPRTATPIPFVPVRIAPGPAANERRPARQRGPIPPGAWRWAAGLVLLAGAAAAAVLNPAMIERLTGTAAPAPSTTSPNDRPAAAAQRTPSGGVSVDPVDGAIEITLLDAPAGTFVAIAFHARPDVIVDSFAADTPRFTARAGHLAVDLGGRVSALRIRLPAGLKTGRILAGGREVATIEAGRIMPAATNTGIVIDGMGAKH